MNIKKISLIATLLLLTFISVTSTYFMNRTTNELDFGVIVSMVVGALFVVMATYKERKT